MKTAENAPSKLGTFAVIKFALFSIIGLGAFFFPITIQGASKIPIDHITGILYKLFSPYYQYLVLVFGLWGLYQTFISKKTYKRSLLDAILSVCQVLGVSIVILLIFKLAPPLIANEKIGPATVISMGKSIIMIACTAFFLPFLIDYGLIDAVGILTKRFMRPLFKTPGLTAIIAASAFLGNFSIGLLSTNSLYKDGKLTYKESIIVATGFSTVSIGLMLLFAQLMGISERFLFYFISTAIVTYIVTAITIRLPPIRFMSEHYHNDIQSPIAEDEIKGKIFRNALRTGINIAGTAPSPLKTVGSILNSTKNVLANMISVSMFLIVAGLLLNMHTPIFSWLGSLFWPIFKLFKTENIDVLMKSTGLSFIDVIPAVMYGSVQQLSFGTRYIIAAFPVSSIIFFGGYFTCLMSTDIRIKLYHLAILWFERMFLALIMYAAIAMLFF